MASPAKLARLRQFAFQDICENGLTKFVFVILGVLYDHEPIIQIADCISESVFLMEFLKLRSSTPLSVCSVGCFHSLWS